MRISKLRRVRRSLAICTIGGPASSIACGIAALVVGEISHAKYDSPWPTFLEFLGAWSFFIGCLGLIPFYVRGFANDGMLLRALLCWKPEATQMIASHALSIARCDGILPPDYHARWFRMAGALTRIKSYDYFSSFTAYADEPDDEKAALCLERCLSYAAFMEEEQRDKLIAEAAYF